MSAHLSNVRPKPDTVLTRIADYATRYSIKSADAFETARYCLIDTLGCGFEALEYPACTKLMGPIVPGTVVPNGAKVPGTQFQLDPVQAAFNIGAMIRWLDFNDTWLAAEWGHPSDNLGGILATADWLSRVAIANGKQPLVMRDVLAGMIKAHEIQGVLALENSFNRVGLDHVVLVKVASTAVVANMIGCTYDEVVNAVSLAWVDGQSLRTYRHAPNTGSRKSWAAGDATSRAVRLALISKTGEMGYPSVLSAKGWGFYDVLFKGKEFKFQRPFGSYVMENVLFKISFPAEFHSQTAVECAMQIHEALKKLGKTPGDIKKITIRTHEACIRIIDKKGPLDNPADRDHCIQYMVAVPILFGRLTAGDYEDSIAKDPAHRHPPRQDRLRRGQALHPGLPRPGQALDRQCADGGVQGRNKIEGDRLRVPDRPQAPPQGGYAGAGGEIPHQPRPAFSRPAAKTHPRPVSGREKAAEYAGQRIRRPVRHLDMQSRGNP